jgi:uncharacterized YigZ family protein
VTSQLELLMDSDSYRTIKSNSRGIYKEKGSRFIASAYPVSYQDEVKLIIDKIRKEHHDAKHHCFAFILGYDKLIRRINDDGEPSGTAGRPILGQINSFGLTNILIVVSRYFGGTLLGVGGLINAYKSAASSAINNAEIIEHTLQEFYEITFPYISMNDVMRILKEESIGQSDQSFDLVCRIKVNFKTSARAKIMNRLLRVKGINCRYLETL